MFCLWFVSPLPPPLVLTPLPLRLPLIRTPVLPRPVALRAPLPTPLVRTPLPVPRILAPRPLPLRPSSSCMQSSCVFHAPTYGKLEHSPPSPVIQYEQTQPRLLVCITPGVMPRTECSFLVPLMLDLMARSGLSRLTSTKKNSRRL